ncbi:MAG TPA: glycosyltransferase family 2 protein [Rhodanobacteraceae bacterium]|nr:glycosyltransferase family 2 protein [Rhodanobacteraceae bacterium]
MSVSIVLCTYNGERWLSQLWDSLLMQTRAPDEIVVRDDASLDGTFELLTKLRDAAVARGIRVTLARNERNLGFVANFEAALADASGEILFLCDQDDIWHPDKLATMLGEFGRRPNLLLLHSDARLVDENGSDMDCGLFEALEVTRRECMLIHSGRAFDVLLRRNLATGATLAFRRSLLNEVKPFPREWVHDEWLAIIAAAIGEVDCLEQPLIDYRQHGGNQIGAQRRSAWSKFEDLFMSRAQALRRELQRMRELLSHFARLDAARTQLPHAKLVARAAHFDLRLGLGRVSKWRRLKPILREARSGSYAVWGNGKLSMLRDLLRRD